MPVCVHSGPHSLTYRYTTWVTKVSVPIDIIIIYGGMLHVLSLSPAFIANQHPCTAALPPSSSLLSLRCVFCPLPLTTNTTCTLPPLPLSLFLSILPPRSLDLLFLLSLLHSQPPNTPHTGTSPPPPSLRPPQSHATTPSGGGVTSSSIFRLHVSRNCSRASRQLLRSSFPDRTYLQRLSRGQKSLWFAQLFFWWSLLQ